MEDREERSKGMEIHISDVFTIIKPTAPFKLAFSSHLKSKVGHILTKAAALRIMMNVDGAPIMTF
jgi:hypothetical protein